MNDLQRFLLCCHGFAVFIRENKQKSEIEFSLGAFGLTSVTTDEEICRNSGMCYMVVIYSFFEHALICFQHVEKDLNHFRSFP